MKTTLLISLLISWWMITTTQANPSAYGRITIHATEAKGQAIKLSTPNLFTLTPTTISEASVDANGTAVLNIPLTHPLFMNVEVGKTKLGLLLSPNDDLEINLAGSSISGVHFSGKGSQTATYLLGATAIWQHFEKRGGKHLLQLDPVGFGRRLDSLQRAYSTFTQDFAKHNAIDKASLHLLQQKSMQQLLHLN